MFFLNNLFGDILVIL